MISAKKFGAAASETQIIRGQWQYQGVIYRDELVRVFADVEDTFENRQFFIDFKMRLKSRFEQIDLWLTSHPIEVL